MLIKVDTTLAAFFYKTLRLTEKARKDQINKKPGISSFIMDSGKIK